MTVITISKEIQFDMGHRVPNHKSKCRNPHGHRYRVVVHCSGYIIETPGSSDEGMLVDFGDLKGLMQEFIHDPLDHGFMLYSGDESLRSRFFVNDGSPEGHAFCDWKIIEVPFIPTAENIAVWCWQQLEGPLETRFQKFLWLDRVEVWETPTSQAVYDGER